ncbi:MAG: hypothetical protein LBK42_02100 [Propionibacteriaceae bacterium]|jgi:hypothetical protein|nr:hypothetical protein [Propionibacteriaceae bacterium]
MTTIAAQTAAATRENGPGIVHAADQPKTLSGGEGGSGRVPAVPPQHPDDETLWRTRQDALDIKTHGERLTPAEIEFCERLGGVYPDIPLSAVLEWIPKDKTMKPTNDFVWLANHGLVIELKSPNSPTASAATRLIRQAITKARRQGVVKNNFIVDFGDQDVNPGELVELARYNVVQRDTKVSLLWVMVKGKPQEIDLE